MNAELLRWLLAAHAFVTLFMTGLIWFVQVVHYPLFNRIGKADFTAYEQQNTRRTGWVVGGPMLLELGLAAALAWSPGGTAAWCGLGLLEIIWLSTAVGQVPVHRRLLRGFDEADTQNARHELSDQWRWQRALYQSVMPCRGSRQGIEPAVYLIHREHVAARQLALCQGNCSRRSQVPRLTTLTSSPSFIDSCEMDENCNASGDRDLCGRILQGAAAIAELQERFRKSLERYLVGMCDRGDGQSQNRAVEIASQILADCFAKSPSLLEQWKGNDNLEAFLRKSAANRLKSYWESAEKKRTVVLEKPDVPEGGTDPNTGEGDEEVAMARKALVSGVAQAAKDCPEGLVFLRLKGLHGVDQREIAKGWGRHESQTSRRIGEAMKLIRNTAGDEAARRGFELAFDDFQQALQRNPSILLGTGGSIPGAGEESMLRLLAAGGADSATKRLAVEVMCANPTALEFFAQLLKRSGESELVVAKDPELSGLHARMVDRVQRSLESIRPQDACGLISPLISDLFADALRSVGADGGTLWLVCPRDSALEAVFNPLEPTINGMRQPLVSGIVSLVLATGESQCVNRVGQHDRHSPAVDIVLGKTTHSMIAVPFAPAGITRGVLTAVHLSSNDAFGLWETAIIERQALVMAELFVDNLARKIAS